MVTQQNGQAYTDALPLWGMLSHTYDYLFHVAHQRLIG